MSTRPLLPAWLSIALCLPAVLPAAAGDNVEPLPGTRPLELEGDIASLLVDGVDRFLLKQIEASVAERSKYWNRDFSSAEAYNKSVEPNRKRLAHILGVRDPRVPFDAPELVATVGQSALIGRGDGFDVLAIRWPVLANPAPNWRHVVSIYGEGLLLVPTDKQPIADVIAIPDADQMPEQIAGLTKGVPIESQFARRLAESGCRVLVPVLISRELKPRTRPDGGGGVNLTNREYIYRSAFELGRHLIGYEVQKVLAGVDWFSKQAGNADPSIGVIGYGEGGMLALLAGALDTRIDAVCVSGFFGPRENSWQEPIDRNVFGLLKEFGAAEIASLVAPRNIVFDSADGPKLTLPGEGGAPARLDGVLRADVEYDRHFRIFEPAGGRLIGEHSVRVHTPSDEPFCSPSVLGSFGQALKTSGEIRPAGRPPERHGPPRDPAVRQARQVAELDQHNQWLLRESEYVRNDFMKNLDTSSLEKYAESVENYRAIFRDEVIGRFELEPLPPDPHTRKSWETPQWIGYEVVLDVFPDVMAYGVLILPKDLKLDGSEKRPVVVCQHGLEGRPTDVFLNDHPAYHDFAARLAERGFITFAPQNLYIFKDRFRTLQRKANPLGKTLFSVIVPQHQQIVDWLQTLPYVDGNRIGFYGLSYGGKSAMRIPALVTDYALSICSADFNEWVSKNASTRHRYSYVWTGEYEIFEWDLGSTFNYAEMAALICPRPFMVERGHFDGVGSDELVAYEYAKVRHLYAARLDIPDRTRIEWFKGPHTINGQGTFAFLHQHLNWGKTGPDPD